MPIARSRADICLQVRLNSRPCPFAKRTSGAQITNQSRVANRVASEPARRHPRVSKVALDLLQQLHRPTHIALVFLLRSY